MNTSISTSLSRFRISLTAVVAATPFPMMPNLGIAYDLLIDSGIEFESKLTLLSIPKWHVPYANLWFVSIPFIEDFLQYN